MKKEKTCRFLSKEIKCVGPNCWLWNGIGDECQIEAELKIEKPTGVKAVPGKEKVL